MFERVPHAMLRRRSSRARFCVQSDRHFEVLNSFGRGLRRSTATFHYVDYKIKEIVWRKARGSLAGCNGTIRATREANAVGTRDRSGGARFGAASESELDPE